MPAGLLRQMAPEEVTCPAGELVGDCDVRCRLVHETVRGRDNPETVERFCAGNYQACNIWRQHREAEAEHKDRPLRRRLERESRAS